MTAIPQLAIVNPAAGGGRCGRESADAIAQLRTRGIEIDVWYTQHAGHGTELVAKAYEEGYRSFIAVGGDGTSYEIVNGLSSYLESDQRPQRCTLGFLPLGTGNSFLRDFTDRGAEFAIEAIGEGQRRACDVIRITHDDGALYFINLFSCGFIADVCTSANTHFKRLGAGGYGLGVMAELARLRSQHLSFRVDGGAVWEQEAIFLSVCNSQFTGGSMQMAPFANASDGEADIVVAGAMSRRTLLALFPKIFSGKHIHHAAITTSRGRHIDFDFDGPVDVMLDGEVVRVRPIALDVLEGAIDVCA